jgi:hypothetical protein
VVVSGDWALSHLPGAVLGIAVAVAMQKWFDEWFLNSSTKFITDSVASLTTKLAGAGVLRTGGRAVVTGGGKVLAFGAK